MNELWRKNLRKIDPYIPGEQSKAPNIIKLNANENPYPSSQRVLEVLHHSEFELRRYPDSNAGRLRSALAKHYKVQDNQIFMGNGSDDVLALCFQSFFCSGEPILFPDITYSFYPVWCSLFHIPYKRIPLQLDYRIDPSDYTCTNGGIILPNPNAPTGIGEDLPFIEHILQANPSSIVIIDEAYIDFGSISALPLLKKYKNLVIVQTMSKSRSLAGLRVGFAIADPTLIAVLEAVKNSYNSYTMDSITIEAAAAAVEDDEYFQMTCTKIIKTREQSAKKLQFLGFEILPSASNFLFATHPQKDAKYLYEKLKTNGIYVRYFDAPRIDQFLRITIGTDEEMEILYQAIYKFVHSKQQT